MADEDPNPNKELSLKKKTLMMVKGTSDLMHPAVIGVAFGLQAGSITFPSQAGSKAPAFEPSTLV